MDEINRTESLIMKHIKNIYTALPGVITKIDPAKMMAQVKISRTEPYGPLETGWLKIKSLYAGRDYGLAFVPYINDECVVCFQNKKLNDGFVLVFAWSEDNPPPEHDIPLRIGDCLLKHKKGTWILLDKDGNIKVFHKSGTVMTITEMGDVYITHNKGHVVMIKADMVDGKVKKKIEGNMGEYKLISLEDIEGDTQARIEVGGDTGLILRSTAYSAHLQGRVMSRNLITLQGIIEEYCEGFIEQVIRRLIDFNFPNVIDYGYFNIDDLLEEDYVKWSQIFLNLTNSGYLNPLNKSHVHKVLTFFNLLDDMTGLEPEEVENVKKKNEGMLNNTLIPETMKSE